MSEFSKTAGNKINIQKLVSFLSLTANYKKKEIKKIIAFTILSKRVKYLVITMQIKDLYLENYKTLMKEVDADK